MRVSTLKGRGRDLKHPSVSGIFDLKPTYGVLEQERYASEIRVCSYPRHVSILESLHRYAETNPFAPKCVAAFPLHTSGNAIGGADCPWQGDLLQNSSPRGRDQVQERLEYGILLSRTT